MDKFGPGVLPSECETVEAWHAWREEDRHSLFSRRRRTGRSSDALAAFATGGDRPCTLGTPTHHTPGSRSGSWNGPEVDRDAPSDLSDLAACERTYAAAPTHLKSVMLPVLDEFRRWILRGVNRHGAELHGGISIFDLSPYERNTVYVDGDTKTVGAYSDVVPVWRSWLGVASRPLFVGVRPDGVVHLCRDVSSATMCGVGWTDLTETSDRVSCQVCRAEAQSRLAALADALAGSTS